MNYALVYNVKDGFHVKNYTDSYEFIRTEVDGWIEHINLPVFDERHIDVWLNEEGKILGLEPTIALFNKKDLVDVVVGTIVFTRYNDDGETLPLSTEDIAYIIHTFDNTKDIEFVYRDVEHKFHTCTLKGFEI